jgi:hypothetical protein
VEPANIASNEWNRQRLSGPVFDANMRGERQQLMVNGQLMIQPAPGPAEYNDAIRETCKRCSERQFQVRRVLVHRVAPRLAAAFFQLNQQIRFDRVEVSDDEVRDQPEFHRYRSTSVRRDHSRRGRCRNREPLYAGRRPGDHYMCRHYSLRWHYPDQVCGSAAQ